MHQVTSKDYYLDKFLCDLALRNDRPIKERRDHVGLE